MNPDSGECTTRICDHGFGGEHMCMNGGSCTIEDDGRQGCLCPAGISGDNCEISEFRTIYKRGRICEYEMFTLNFLRSRLLLRRDVQRQRTVSERPCATRLPVPVRQRLDRNRLQPAAMRPPPDLRVRLSLPVRQTNTQEMYKQSVRI